MELLPDEILVIILTDVCYPRRDRNLYAKKDYIKNRNDTWSCRLVSKKFEFLIRKEVCHKKMKVVTYCEEGITKFLTVFERIHHVDLAYCQPEDVVEMKEIVDSIQLNQNTKIISWNRNVINHIDIMKRLRDKTLQIDHLSIIFQLRSAKYNSDQGWARIHDHKLYYDFFDSVDAIFPMSSLVGSFIEYILNKS